MVKIHDIGNYALRNYLIETDKGFITIDTGYPGGFENFIKRFKEYVMFSDLKYILLTHVHDDYTGFLGDLLYTYNAKIILHKLTSSILKSGSNPMPECAEYSSRIASLFGVFKKDFSFPSVIMDSIYILVTEESQYFQDLGLSFKIVELPSHTEDSIGLYPQDTKKLFCGDAAMNAIINPKRCTIWINNIKDFQASWYKIIDFSPALIYPSHGDPFV